MVDRPSMWDYGAVPNLRQRILFGRYYNNTYKWILETKPSYALWLDCKSFPNDFPKLSDRMKTYLKLECLRRAGWPPDINQWVPEIDYDIRRRIVRRTRRHREIISNVHGQNWDDDYDQSGWAHLEGPW